MHFVTGGAHNGKLDWVKKHYELEEGNYTLISAYEGSDLPDSFEGYQTDVIVIEGLESFVKSFFNQEKSVKSQSEAFLLACLNFKANNPDKQLVLIGQDISKGVVPVDPEERKLRDIVGILYQRLNKMSERFDIIWYGINRQLK